MAHFAELDSNNVVLRVIVIDNSIIVDNGQELEQLGINFCKSLYGQDTNWLQTSYNESFRYNYAGVGFQYDTIKDAFIAPKPYPSWILDNNTLKWKSPIQYPTDNKNYYWDEYDLSWVEYQPMPISIDPFTGQPNYVL